MDTNVIRREYHGEYGAECHGECHKEYGGQYRGEYKTPGGKLVAVTVGADGVDGAVGTDTAARRRHVRIDGDFFVESASDTQSDALLHDIEQALSGIRAFPPAAIAGSTAAVKGADVVRDVAAEVAEAITRHPDVRLIGTDAAAIAMAYARAVGVPTETGTDAAALASRPGASTAAPATPAPAPAAPVESGASASSLVPAATPESAFSASARVTPTSATPAQPTESDDFDERWARLWPQLAVVHDVPRSPAEQMAVDERWAREVASGLRPWGKRCVIGVISFPGGSASQMRRALRWLRRRAQ